MTTRLDVQRRNDTVLSFCTLHSTCSRRFSRDGRLRTFMHLKLIKYVVLLSLLNWSTSIFSKALFKTAINENVSRNSVFQDTAPHSSWVQSYAAKGPTQQTQTRKFALSPRGASLCTILACVSMCLKSLNTETWCWKYLWRFDSIWLEMSLQQHMDPTPALRQAASGCCWCPVLQVLWKQKFKWFREGWERQQASDFCCGWKHVSAKGKFLSNACPVCAI